MELSELRGRRKYVTCEILQGPRRPWKFLDPAQRLRASSARYNVENAAEVRHFRAVSCEVEADC